MRYIIAIFVIFVCYISILSEELKVDFFKLSSIILSGSNNDWSGKKIINDKTGNIYWVGSTESKDFPVSSVGYNKKLKGKSDAVVCKFDKNLKMIASTLIGGSSKEEGFSISLDEEGFIYVLGVTNSVDFPVTKDSYDKKLNGEKSDLFITKLNNDLSKMISSTYIGGSDREGTGFYMEITVNKNDVIIAGNTLSKDFPVTGKTVFQKPYKKEKINDSDAFITILDKGLSKIKYSTYFGGQGDDQLKSVKIDSEGNIFIAGHTLSDDIPTTKKGYKKYYEKGGYNIFVTKLNRNLSKIIASTYLGNDANDFAYSMTVSSQDNVFICGHVGHKFPTSKNAYDTTRTGLPDEAYIAKLDSNLEKVLASTFLGGGGSLNPGGKYCTAISVDKNENVYVIGSTTVSDFPVSPNAVDEVFNGNRDLFITKLNSDLSSLRYSTFLGGKENDESRGILIGKMGEIIVSGYSKSKNFPDTVNKIKSKNQKYNVFLSILKPDDILSQRDVFTAVKSNKLNKLVRLLKKEKNTILKKDKDQRTLLHWAAQYGYKRMAEFLISKSKIINKQDLNGSTALHLASMSGQIEMVKLLLSRGGDASIPDTNGNLPIHIASFYGSAAVLPYLPHANSNLEILNKRGYTPLHMAVISNQADAVKQLIKMGSIIINKKNKKTFIAKSAVLSRNNIEVIDLLLKNGIKINTKDETGQTLLSLAINAWWEKTAIFLVNKGADVDAIDDAGRSPIFYAIEKGFENLVSLLVTSGAKLNIQDKNGKTPIDISKEKKHINITKILQEEMK